jgi:hypothetical protein
MEPLEKALRLKAKNAFTVRALARFDLDGLVKPSNQANTKP